MSLYNMVNGANPAVLYILPMLEGKHPDEYPRFRDCFAVKHDMKLVEGWPVMVHDTATKPEDRLIYLFTRTGGGNRDSYIKEIERLKALPGFVRDYDDEFDTTFMTFVFKVPEQWIADYDLIINNKMLETSQEYRQLVAKTYPKIADKLKVALQIQD